MAAIPHEPESTPTPRGTAAWVRAGPRNPWDDPTLRPHERGASRLRQRAKIAAIQALAIARDAWRDEEGEGLGARILAASDEPELAKASELTPRERLHARVRGDNSKHATHATRRVLDLGGETASPPDLRPCGCERRRPHRAACRFAASSQPQPQTQPQTQPQPTKEDPVTLADSTNPASPAPTAPATRPCGCRGTGSHSPRVCTLMSPEERTAKLAVMQERMRNAQKVPRKPKAPKATASTALAHEPASPSDSSPPASSPATPAWITASLEGVTFTFASAVEAAAFARELRGQS